MEKYLSNHPQLKNIDNAIRKAWNNPGKLVRVSAGWYVVRINDEMVEIDHIDRNEADYEYWIAREMTPGYMKWYSDSEKTLRDLKLQLGL